MCSSGSGLAFITPISLIFQEFCLIVYHLTQLIGDKCNVIILQPVLEGVAPIVWCIFQGHLHKHRENDCPLASLCFSFLLIPASIAKPQYSPRAYICKVPLPGLLFSSAVKRTLPCMRKAVIWKTAIWYCGWQSVV